MRAKIAEIFKSIQGEGIYQGVEQVFVRFFGCNLQCSFCDTQQPFYEDMDLARVIDKISGYKNYHSIAVTGGEPLLPIDFLEELLSRLKQQDKKVYLETNGTLASNLGRVIKFVDIVAMDFKLPSSTCGGDFWPQHRQFLRAAKEKNVFVKAVITRNTLMDDIYKAIEVIKEIDSGTPFILQPCNPDESLLKDKLEYLSAVCASNGIKAKVIPPMHKALGVR